MKKDREVKYSTIKYLNKPILIMTLVFSVLGAFLILDASSISAVRTYGFDTPYYYFIRQIIFIVIGYVLSIFIINYPTKFYKGTGLFLSAVSLIALFVIFIKNSLFSSSVSEVAINIGSFKFQPGEFIKVFLIMYMSSFYGSWVNRNKDDKWWIPLIFCGASAGLIFLGGDYGSAAIMLTLYALIFISVPTKNRTINICKMILVGGIFLAVFGLKFGYKIIPQSKLESSYRWNRFIYTNPCDRYEENSGYQVCNGYIAIDNGGLFGVGPGKSVQKYMYLPASHTDFIFPIVVEELGVISGVILILLYMLLIGLIFRVALRTRNLQNSLICYGIAIYFMLHIFVNLGGVLGIIPLTGVPLPFLSYGGSFCITIICSFAIVQRINIENEIERHKNA